MNRINIYIDRVIAVLFVMSCSSLPLIFVVDIASSVAI